MTPIVELLKTQIARILINNRKELNKTLKGLEKKGPLTKEDFELLDIFFDVPISNFLESQKELENLTVSEKREKNIETFEKIERLVRNAEDHTVRIKAALKELKESISPKSENDGQLIPDVLTSNRFPLDMADDIYVTAIRRMEEDLRPRTFGTHIHKSDMFNENMIYVTMDLFNSHVLDIVQTARIHNLDGVRVVKLNIIKQTYGVYVKDNTESIFAFTYGNNMEIISESSITSNKELEVERVARDAVSHYLEYIDPTAVFPDPSKLPSTAVINTTTMGGNLEITSTDIDLGDIVIKLKSVVVVVQYDKARDLSGLAGDYEGSIHGKEKHQKQLEKDFEGDVFNAKAYEGVTHTHRCPDLKREPSVSERVPFVTFYPEPNTGKLSAYEAMKLFHPESELLTSDLKEMVQNENLKSEQGFGQIMGRAGEEDFNSRSVEHINVTIEPKPEETSTQPTGFKGVFNFFGGLSSVEVMSTDNPVTISYFIDAGYTVNYRQRFADSGFNVKSIDELIIKSVELNVLDKKSFASTRHYLNIDRTIKIPNTPHPLFQVTATLQSPLYSDLVSMVIENSQEALKHLLGLKGGEKFQEINLNLRLDKEKMEIYIGESVIESDRFILKLDSVILRTVSNVGSYDLLVEDSPESEKGDQSKTANPLNYGGFNWTPDIGAQEAIVPKSSKAIEDKTPEKPKKRNRDKSIRAKDKK